MDNKLTLQPGLIMVSLSSTVTGGVSYDRKDLDQRCGRAGADAMGSASSCKLLAGHGGPCDFAALTKEEITRWETTRTIADKAEHEKATKVRNKARSLITGVTTHSTFGEFCQEAKEAELDARYAEAKAMVEDFNRQAKFTRVGIYMVKANFPASQSNTQSISSEVVELLDHMISGISAGDEEAVRAAASKLTEVSEMLGEGAKLTVERAVSEARSAARAIVKAKEEQAAGVTLGAGTVAQQKADDKGKQAAQTLKAAKKVLDMNSNVLDMIEAASKKAG